MNLGHAETVRDSVEYTTVPSSQDQRESLSEIVVHISNELIEPGTRRNVMFPEF